MIPQAGVFRSLCSRRCCPAPCIFSGRPCPGLLLIRISGDSDLLGGGVMFLTAVLFALVMVVLARTGGESPFVLAASLGLVCWLVFLVAGVAMYGRLLVQRGVMVYLLRRFLSPAPFLVVLGYMDFSILAYSFRYADPQVVGVLFEVWPVFLILVVARFSGDRYDRIGWPLMGGLVLSFFGVALVLSSVAGGPAGLLGLMLGSGWRGLVLAALLPLGAAGVSGFTGFTWVWAARTAQRDDVPAAVRSGRTQEDVDRFFLYMCPCFTAFCHLVVVLVMAFATGQLGSGEPVPVSLVLWGVACGVGYGVGGLLWRLSTCLTRNVGVHSVCYVTPVCTLLLMWAWGLVVGVGLPYLALGVALVVLGNLSVSFRGLLPWWLCRVRGILGSS